VPLDSDCAFRGAEHVKVVFLKKDRETMKKLRSLTDTSERSFTLPSNVRRTLEKSALISFSNKQTDRNFVMARVLLTCLGMIMYNTGCCIVTNTGPIASLSPPPCLALYERFFNLISKIVIGFPSEI